MSSVHYDKSSQRFQRLTETGTYSSEQCAVIMESIERGLDDLEIKVYLNEKMNPDQMRRCMYGITYGLSLVDVEKYAK